MIKILFLAGENGLKSSPGDRFSDDFSDNQIKSLLI